MSAPLPIHAYLGNGLLRKLVTGHQYSSLPADVPWLFIAGRSSGGDPDGLF